MAAQDLLQPKVETCPIIYAYSDTRYPDTLKVGFTTRPIEVRMHEHYPTVVPGQSWKVELVRPAMRNDGTTFDDHAVHEVLRNSNIRCVAGEWYKCRPDAVARAINAVARGADTILWSDRSFGMRDEQEEAVRKTSEYFFRFYSDPHNHGLTPHFLWNAKMRFGKTFTTYQLALRMHWRRVLVLTFKPAVRSAWKEDLLTHTNFAGWQFCEKRDDRNFSRVDALNPVYDAMDNPQETKTITLSCGKLSTGVTVRPWSGIFMLRNSSSPETYFQAAFRVQSPWTTQDEYGKEQVLKPVCYVFDFAPDRALKQVADYSCRLNINEDNPETKVGEFIRFLPILAYDGNSMKEIDAAGILDMAMSGTTSTLLARRWKSALLVNVDNATLLKLMGNADAMRALQNIEGFRALRQDIETIINKSEQIKKAKQQKEKLTERQKRDLTEEEKKTKSLRKQIQEKLIKFAIRIPVFMYLTDFHEYCLRDVITQLEPELFRKVTGLTIPDFELLISLNVFNAALMNDAVYKFKRYEDSSLSYTGIQAQEMKGIGLYDTVIYPSKQGGIVMENQEWRTSASAAKSAATESDVSDTQQKPEDSPVQKKAETQAIRKQAGDKVLHKSFGEGVVVSIDDKYITCRFSGNREKKFYYPQVFEQGYLG